MNTGNPLSNSKHSLFDHFKRNFDTKFNIPKFDVNTGLLSSKGKRMQNILIKPETLKKKQLFIIIL
jgi:hypothetical protein